MRTIGTHAFRNYTKARHLQCAFSQVQCRSTAILKTHGKTLVHNTVLVFNCKLLLMSLFQEISACSWA